MAAIKGKNIAAPRSVKRQKAREKIFESALQLLKEFGYEYLTIGNICEVAGISTGNFYHYFDSKESLLSQFFIDAYEKFLNEEGQPDTGDLVSDIIAYYCAYADFCEEHGLEFIRNFYSPYNRVLDMTPSGGGENEFGLTSMNETRDKIERAREAGFFSADIDAVQMAQDLCNIEKGIIFNWCVSEGSFHISDETRRLLTHYLQPYRINAIS